MIRFEEWVLCSFACVRGSIPLFGHQLQCIYLQGQSMKHNVPNATRDSSVYSWGVLDGCKSRVKERREKGRWEKGRFYAQTTLINRTSTRCTEDWSWDYTTGCLYNTVSKISQIASKVYQIGRRGGEYITKEPWIRRWTEAEEAGNATYCFSNTNTFSFFFQ